MYVCVWRGWRVLPSAGGVLGLSPSLLASFSFAVLRPILPGLGTSFFRFFLADLVPFHKQVVRDEWGCK